ncbi:hypothetical protein [Streptomyces sp. NBC_01428]|uniref:hypothetical protein n=1 Tax=Streptomyces sp. NBC_01428 TaxID=2903861 RepID=UPI002E337872|nr:hypothetical protein [Streptomyces sp. NBC_01428]
MNVTPVTPPRPIDVAAVFPQLAPLARTATRLHPRPGAPTWHDSSIGGPLLWPAEEPWPHCEEPHVVDGINPAKSPADLRLERRIFTASHGRDLTPEERESLERIRPRRTYPVRRAAQAYDGPMAMLPVAQLYVRDVPDLSPPEGKDLLQVLWCPFDHPIMPRTLLCWRSAAAVTDILDTPPEPPAVQFDGYLPEPCVLEPEQITEYPDHLELSEELREQLKEWSVPQAAEEDMDPDTYYDCVLSNAPGWKVGGWPAWNSTDPSSQSCSECGTGMEVLMTVATFEEGDDAGNSWSPHPHPGAGPYPGHRGYNATGVQIGSGYRQHLFVCPAEPEHPHIELMT